MTPHSAHSRTYLVNNMQDFQLEWKISNCNRTEWSPIRSDNTSDNKIGRPRSGSPIYQTEFDNTKSYYQLIIKITIYEKRRIPRYEKEKFALKVFTLFLGWLKPRMCLVDLNYNFVCPLTNCPITSCPITTWQVN